jgi:ssDNA-specific exonuclease RecJ
MSASIRKVRLVLLDEPTEDQIRELAREECIKVLYVLFKNESGLRGDEAFEEFKQYIEREIQHAI